VDTTGPLVYRPCSRRAGALHRSPHRHRISLRIGLPRRPCCSSLHRGTGVWQPPFGRLPWHTVPLHECAGNQGYTGAAWHRVATACFTGPPSPACHLSTAAWRKATLHRCRGRRCGRRRPGPVGTLPAVRGASSLDKRAFGCCLARPLRSTMTGPVCRFIARRSSTFGLSAAGLIGPPRSTEPGAAHRFTAQVPVVQATERFTASPSVAVDAVPTRRVTDRHKASLSVPVRDGSLRERFRQRTGRSRRAAWIRSRRVPPGCRWSPAGEPARAAGHRGRIASAVPN